MAEISGAFLRFGFADILQIPYFKNMKIDENPLTEYDMLPVEMDDLVRPFLHTLGMSTEKDNFIVDACKYRSKIDNTIKLGFCYFGKERTDGAWISNPNSSLQAFIETERDSMQKGELFKLSRQGIGAGGFEAMSLKAINRVSKKQLNEFKTELDFDDDWRTTEELIESMNQIVYEIRKVKV